MDNSSLEMQEKVSIIIPCYNDTNYIEQSINSALNQDYRNIEVIVIDDGSNQKTKAKLKHLESGNFKLITQENKGASAARNIGIDNSSGKYILALDSDDYFDESFCTKAVTILNDDAEAKIVSCYAHRFGKRKNDIIKHTNATLKDFLKFNHALGNALFYKKDWETVGGYDEKMTYGYEDWEFFIRILETGGYSHIIPEILFHYRLKESSNSTIAESRKYELLQYIYKKHKHLYIEHYEILVDHLLARLEIVEKAERKNLTKIDFRLGKAILKPFRKISAMLK